MCAFVSHVLRRLPCNAYKVARQFIGKQPHSNLYTWQKKFPTQNKSLFRCQSTVAATISPRAQKVVGWWMMGCGGMVFGAVVLGGVTRLTESGLSMVRWNLFGEKPPFNDAEWQTEFQRYQEFPEYKMKNTNMTLEEFKWIWHMEYGHRMWGRFIGAAFYLPAAFFWAKGYLTKPAKVRVVICGSLLAFQGLLGWYMVKSGLDENNFKGPSDIPRVSQYRLAAHLGSALLLYVFLFRAGLSNLWPSSGLSAAVTGSKKLRILAHSSKALIFLTAISGAFVAGLDAGLVYNSFPTMAGKWIPEDVLSMEPTWKNFTENATTVQFDHRWLGSTTLLLVSTLWLHSRKVCLPPRARAAVNAVAVMACLQVTLGITTLLMYVPTHIAAMHQSGSLTLLSFIMWLTHELKKIPK